MTGPSGDEPAGIVFEYPGGKWTAAFLQAIGNMPHSPYFQTIRDLIKLSLII